MEIKQKIDVLKPEYKSNADLELWLKMKISAMKKKQTIARWVMDAIKLKLDMEDSNEK
jgi:hypothetical protein